MSSKYKIAKVREKTLQKGKDVYTRPEESSLAKEISRRLKPKKNHLQDSINKNNKRVRESMKKKMESKKKKGFLSKIFGK